MFVYFDNPIYTSLWKQCHDTCDQYATNIIEPPHDKTNKMACASSEDSNQPGHPPSLIIVFAVRMKKAGILTYPLSAQRRLWSDWGDAQADLSLRWAHSHFVCFVMRRLRWTTSWENLFYAICEQQRCRSACASTQSDQSLCFSPLPR